MRRLLVLDLDGTLVDSRRDIAGSLNFALEKEGFPTLSQDKIDNLVGWGAKQLVMEALGHPREEDLMRVFRSFWDRYDLHLLDETSLFPGVREFLEATGHWQRALVTNKPESFTRKILQGLEIRNYFSWVIGGDSLPVRKPDPLVLNPIRNELGSWEKGVMVGDSVVDLQFGKAAGLMNCTLTHGFGIREELVAGGPDFLVEDFSQLGKLEIWGSPE